MCPVDPGSSLSDPDQVLTRQGLDGQEDTGDAATFIFVVNAVRATRSGWQRRPGFPDQLAGSFIHADHGMESIIPLSIDIEHLLHTRHKLATASGWNHPLLLLPGLQFVFFSTRRTVSWEMAST